MLQNAFGPHFKFYHLQRSTPLFAQLLRSTVFDVPDEDEDEDEDDFSFEDEDSEEQDDFIDKEDYDEDDEDEEDDNLPF